MSSSIPLVPGWHSPTAPRELTSREVFNLKIEASDLGTARRLVCSRSDRMRYCHPWKRWLVWDGKRWAADQTGEVLRAAKCVVENSLGQPSGQEIETPCFHPANFGNHQRLKSMVALAAPELAILPEQLDRDPWLLNCDNGTLDLRTGELREHQQQDNITRLCPTPYVPDAPHPNWDRFLSTVFSEAAVIEFVQRFLGYCLTGDVREQLLPIFWGDGSKGKSTLLETFLHVLGRDYGMKAPADLLVVRKNEAHPAERAELFGKRFVACVESGEERRLNEPFVKELTGGDSIRARHLYQSFWEFLPTHKVVLCTNHCPEVSGTDLAIWRRLALVPFRATFWDPDKGESGLPEQMQDKCLAEKLKSEAPGILAWCVQGCRDWQAHRLKLPPNVIEATKRYRLDEDSVSAFIEDRCVVGENHRVRALDLYTDYVIWCDEQGRQDLGNRLFGQTMGKRFERIKSNGNWYHGIGRKQEVASDSGEW